MNFLIKILKKIIIKYELKYPEFEKPVHICENINTRNRNKNDKYKIPEDQPQCPIYKDNRCCGGCKLAPDCNHCVNCNCYGFTFSVMGGNDKNYHLHKASNMYGLGRIDNDGKFDWDYYYLSKKKKEIIPDKYINIGVYTYKIISKVNRKGNFTAYNLSKSKFEKFNINELDKYIYVYDNDNIAINFL